MDASLISQMKSMEDENRRLKRMYADLSVQECRTQTARRKESGCHASLPAHLPRKAPQPPAPNHSARRPTPVGGSDCAHPVPLAPSQECRSGAFAAVQTVLQPVLYVIRGHDLTPPRAGAGQRAIPVKRPPQIVEVILCPFGPFGEDVLMAVRNRPVIVHINEQHPIARPGPGGAMVPSIPTRITLENNAKIRLQPDGENAFVRASGGRKGTDIEPSLLLLATLVRGESASTMLKKLRKQGDCQISRPCVTLRSGGFGSAQQSF